MAIRRLRTAAVLAAFALMLTGTARAQEPPPFTLDNQTIRILMDSRPGGMSDTQARILIEYLGRYLPGTPNFVVQNLNGAGGLRLLEYLNELDPQSNYVIFTSPSALPFRARAGLVDPALYDPRNVNWVGSFRGSTLFCLVRTDTGVETLDDLRQHELRFGANSRSGNSYAILTLLNEQLGTRMQPIVGYQNSADVALAVDRGEIDGQCNNYATFKQHLEPMVEEGRARILFYMGPERRDDIEAPYLFDLPMPEEARAFISSALAAISFAGPYAIPLGSDPAFVDAVRQAFAATMADPDFIAAAEAAGIDLAYVSAEGIADNVRKLFETPDEVINEIGTLFFGD